MNEEKKLSYAIGRIETVTLSTENAKKIFEVAKKKFESVNTLMEIDDQFVYNKDYPELRYGFLMLEATMKLMEEQLSIATKAIKTAAKLLVEFNMAVILKETRIEEQAKKGFRHSLAIIESRQEEIDILATMLKEQAEDIV